MSKTRKITTCAMLLALASVLTYLSKVIPSPWLQGGEVTIASMVPIIAASIILDTKWGLATSLTYSLLRIIIMGFMVPPVKNFSSFLIVILLDYVIAFGVFGFAGSFYRLFGKKIWAIPLSGIIVSVFRYLCHFVSGIVIWGVYAPEGQSVVMYSIIYNAGFMIPETIITTIVLGSLSWITQSQARKQ